MATEMNKQLKGLTHGNRQRTSRNNTSRKTQKYILLGMLLLLLILYLCIAFYYRSHFFSKSTINGVDVSNLTLGEGKDAINAQIRSYQLTLQGRNDISDSISGEDIDLHSEFDQSISDLLEQQNGFAWPIALLKTHTMEIATILQYDENRLTERFNQLSFFAEENIIEPENAFISEYGEKGYVIIPEKHGAKLKKDEFFEAVKDAITKLESALSIEELGHYKKPKITSESPKLINALDIVNRMVSTEITYEFGEDTEVLDGDRISGWISIDNKFKVHLDVNGVKEFVDEIGKNYNSFGRTRTFTTSYGNVIKVEGGDYGWWLNRPAEVEELVELIENGEQLVKEPVYYQTANQYGKDDIGDTYVEVNLTAQHLFFYKDGKLILQSEFVSGNLSKDYGTPTGTYPIQYKENDATLEGEDYSTPVKYWMPFNGNIGFHDASWREEFGGDIYKTNGSHGCINMPPENAKIMFQNIKRGVAVIVYELSGTETY